MLDTLTVVGAQEFLDLPTSGLSLLIQWHTDTPIRRRHGARSEPRIFALDVEIPDLTKAEDAFVEAGPMRHAPTVDVVGEMVDGM